MSRGHQRRSHSLSQIHVKFDWIQKMNHSGKNWHSNSSAGNYSHRGILNLAQKHENPSQCKRASESWDVVSENWPTGEELLALRGGRERNNHLLLLGSQGKGILLLPGNTEPFCHIFGSYSEKQDGHHKDLIQWEKNSSSWPLHRNQRGRKPRWPALDSHCTPPCIVTLHKSSITSTFLFINQQASFLCHAIAWLLFFVLRITFAGDTARFLSLGVESALHLAQNLIAVLQIYGHTACGRMHW